MFFLSLSFSVNGVLITSTITPLPTAAAATIPATITTATCPPYHLLPYLAAVGVGAAGVMVRLEGSRGIHLPLNHPAAATIHRPGQIHDSIWHSTAEAATTASSASPLPPPLPPPLPSQTPPSLPSLKLEGLREIKHFPTQALAHVTSSVFIINEVIYSMYIYVVLVKHL